MTSLPIRREFLKGAATSGALLFLDPSRLFARPAAWDDESAAPRHEFKFATLSVDRLPELKRELEKLDEKGLVSDHPTFRSYINGFEFTVPKNFPEARSIIVVSQPSFGVEIRFHIEGQVHRLVAPPGYVAGTEASEGLQEEILRRATGSAEGRAEATSLPLKLLAARSGLGAYGRNNICFVPEYGTRHALFALYTEAELADQWREVTLLRKCRGCRICIDQCPTGCLDEERFVLDAGHCVTLYNEVPGEMPDWIDPTVHNALIGCTKCSQGCPANKEYLAAPELLAEITEEESMMLLFQDWQPELVTSVKAKLARLSLSGDLKHLSANLMLLLDAVG